MKYLVFSDTHFSHKFNEEYFIALQNIIKDADKVIINGDLWERYLTTFDKFISSDWKKLFPLLKEKNTIYLQGNHDLKGDLDDNYKLFADEVGRSFDVISNNSKFHIQHGHSLTGALKESSTLADKHRWAAEIILFFGFGIYEIFFKIFNKSPAAWMNNRIKKHWHHKDITLITGHTHQQELSINYANAGMNMFGYLQYITIENGKIELHKSRIY